MLSRIQEAASAQDFVALYLYKDDPEVFIFGKVVACDENHFILSTLTQNGFWDGYMLRRTGKVFKVERGGRYERKMNVLSRVRATREKDHPLSVAANVDLKRQLLDTAAAGGHVIGLGVEDSDPLVCGAVVGMKDGLLSIALLDEYGGDDGLVVLHLEDIDYVELHSLECRSLEYLRQDRD